MILSLSEKTVFLLQKSLEVFSRVTKSAIQSSTYIMFAFDFLQALFKFSYSESLFKDSNGFEIEDTVSGSAEDFLLSFILLDAEHISVKI